MLKLLRRKCGLRRKRSLIMVIVLTSLIALSLNWRLSKHSSDALLPPQEFKNLDHFRRSRSMKHYLDNVNLLIEPSIVPCESVEEVPVVIMVGSGPTRQEQRNAIRNTWGKHLPTFFTLGLKGENFNDEMVDTYVEAKQYSDLVVYDFIDHYQNLTLKTAVMMRWMTNRCPQAKFMFKVDDDVFVNPWTLQDVLNDNADAKIIGYKIKQMFLHRDTRSKWFLPRWLWYEDVVSEYIAGSSYLINGDYIKKILHAALKTPMINLEDIYFTYVVGMRTLHYNLTDDKRINHFKPMLPLSCIYWRLAAAHSLEPDELLQIWSKIEVLSQIDKETDCNVYHRYLSSEMLFY